MKNLLLKLLVIAAVVAGFGFYRGWFFVNRAQLERDERAAKAKLEELEQKVKDGAAALGQPTNKASKSPQ